MKKVPTKASVHTVRRDARERLAEPNGVDAGFSFNTPVCSGNTTSFKFCRTFSVIDTQGVEFCDELIIDVV